MQLQKVLKWLRILLYKESLYMNFKRSVDIVEDSLVKHQVQLKF